MSKINTSKKTEKDIPSAGKASKTPVKTSTNDMDVVEMVEKKKAITSKQLSSFERGKNKKVSVEKSEIVAGN